MISALHYLYMSFTIENYNYPLNMDFYFTLMLALFAVFKVITCCPTDCSSQAGVSCDIISSDTACHHRDSPVVDYPGQLTTFDIHPIASGQGAVGLNVTWNHTGQTAEKVSGYEIQYWSYQDFDEPSTSKLSLCTLYNFTSQQSPDVGTLLFHTCVSSPTRVIKISTQPQENPDTDYLHRVTAGYNQDHGLNSAKWQPPLVIIHNDSCNNQVEVQLYLAPKSFHFTHYRIALADMADYNNNVDKDVYVEPGDIYTMVTFTDVKDGTYKLYIVAEPNDSGTKCRCITEYCEDEHCVLSITGAFYIKDDHPKCPQILTTESFTTTESPTGPPALIPDSILIMMCILVPVGLLLTIAILILVYRKQLDGCGIKKMLSKFFKSKDPEVHSPGERRHSGPGSIGPCSIRGSIFTQSTVQAPINADNYDTTTRSPSNKIIDMNNSTENSEAALMYSQSHHQHPTVKVLKTDSLIGNREKENCEEDSQITKACYSINHLSPDLDSINTTCPPADLSNYECISDYDEEIINSNDSQSALIKNWNDSYNNNKDISSPGTSQKDSGLPSSWGESKQCYSAEADIHNISSGIPLGKYHHQVFLGTQPDGLAV